ISLMNEIYFVITSLFSLPVSPLFSSHLLLLLPLPPDYFYIMDFHIRSAKFLLVKSQSGTKEPAGGNSSHPVNHSDIGGISELEQLLKQKTFTGSEIEHLVELLHSRAEEVLAGERTQEALPELASSLGRHRQFSSSPLEEDRNERGRYHGVNTTISNSRVLEDDIASPAELAKAYMGSGPSKISPSKLVMRGQIGRDDARLLGNVPFTPKSPFMSSTTRVAVNVGVPENSFITPRSRGRSAIYNMARTPCPRVNPTAILKGYLFGSSSGSLVSGTVTQSMPISFGSSLPSSSITNNTSFASSSANSRVPSTIINFGFCSAASSSKSNAAGLGSGPTASVFNFGVSSAVASDVGAISSNSGATLGLYSFGLGSSSFSANVVGSSSGATPSIFSFGSSSAASTSGINAASSFSSGTSDIFSFGASSSASSSATNSVSSSNPTINLFGSSWQSPKSPILGSTFTSLSSSETSNSTINLFGSSWQSPKSPILGSTFTSLSSSETSNSTINLFGSSWQSPKSPILGSTFTSLSSSETSNSTINLFGSSWQSPKSPILGSTFTSLSSSETSNSTINLFGSSWQSPKSPILGSTFTSLSSSESNAAGLGSGPTASVFNFGVSSAAASDVGAISSNSGVTLGLYSFGLSSSSSSANVVGSTSGATPSIFSFGSSSAASTSGINAASSFSSGTSGIFSFGASSSASSSATNSVSSSNRTTNLFGQPTVSPSPPGFMFGSTVPSSVPLFGQPTFSPSPSDFILGSTVPAQPNSFQFAGQQHQVAPQSPSPFQASARTEFNTSGSFSLRSGGGDKLGRKYVKANGSKNQKK
ncbi:nuclear pore complex protein NUP62-like, partial [Olea europaea var. sylvestris]|uniref:nuclear pore complex protein NUP62-like n=1 Tax=Olea europaea var. sylvestris TaxID=158386 RepID=UPI000C1CDB34